MRYCFFADYEIHLAERLCIRGQTTLVHATADGIDLDPADVLERVRAQAAGSHGVTPSEVRVRALNRLD
ncbi:MULTISPECIES: hypothetical protein [unclassified Lysobacter]|uniref:hypothetical protein n=1 Tax=unclassified Lysobacter TaxID=2635362 RepID=UPI001C249D20|nr:hypothetical protein [Lysobacter sp. MMG2]MBU8978037.1 hypothetical protein [Lysobacter sp. MMG2]